MCGIIGYVGQRACKDLLLQGLERLEYRGYDSAGLALREDGELDVRARRRQPPGAEARSRLERLAGEDGSRPHALGHPRRRQRAERAPAHRLRRAQARDRAERDRRELPRAEGVARGRGPRLPHRDRRRGGRPPDRAPLRRRPARGDAPGLPRARGPLRLRRHPPRPSRGARRSAAPVPAARRRRERRDVPRLDGRGLHRRDALDPADRGRRGRLDHARGLALRLRRARRARARGGRGRLGHRGRREERLRDLHAEGDLRAARRRRRDARRPDPARRARAGEPGPERDRAAEPAPDRDRRRGHLVPRGRRRPLHDRGVGAGAGRARHRERVDLPQPGALEGHARDRDLAVRRVARHRQRDQARAATSARGRWRSRT